MKSSVVVRCNTLGKFASQKPCSWFMNFTIFTNSVEAKAYAYASVIGYVPQMESNEYIPMRVRASTTADNCT